MTQKSTQCFKCGAISFIGVEDTKLRENFLKADEFKITEEVKTILASPKDAYQKKIALFNFLKNLEVGELELGEEKRINCLLEGKLYNEMSKQKLKEYKKLTVEDFSRI